jgi:hypothetical protein
MGGGGALTVLGSRSCTFFKMVLSDRIEKAAH